MIDRAWMTRERWKNIPRAERLRQTWEARKANRIKTIRRHLDTARKKLEDYGYTVTEPAGLALQIDTEVECAMLALQQEQENA